MAIQRGSDLLRSDLPTIAGMDFERLHFFNSDDFAWVSSCSFRKGKNILFKNGFKPTVNDVLFVKNEWVCRFSRSRRDWEIFKHINN